MSRVVTLIEGERMESDRNFVGDDVCCVELGLGCEIIGADIFPTDDYFVDGTCHKYLSNPCETCDLSFYKPTIYNFFFPTLKQVVVNGELLT